uniref:Uncharacterized protein n=1 Tax=Rhizophora mucronata TaxID=61149 RepID=A0A2P2PPP8_RHIMU
MDRLLALKAVVLHIARMLILRLHLFLKTMGVHNSVGNQTRKLTKLSRR